VVAGTICQNPLAGIEVMERLTRPMATRSAWPVSESPGGD